MSQNPDGQHPPAYQDIQVIRTDGVVHVVLNRPDRHNAVTVDMVDELIAAFDQVAQTRSDRALVLRAAGRSFCSGADLASLPKTGGYWAMKRVSDLIVGLHRLPVPTIASVGGAAIGLGANLALACDLVLAGESAHFTEIFSRRGLSLDAGGSWLLPRLVGLQKAKEIAFFGDDIPAAEAAAMGLVNRVVPDDQLAVVTSTWAARLAAGPPIGLAMTKRMLNDSVAGALEQAIDGELRAQMVNFGTADAREGVTAYLQRREPRFEGR